MRLESLLKNIIRMFLKNLMRKRSLRKFKKLMRFYLMRIKEDNMINLVMRHLVVTVLVELLVMTFLILIFPIYLVIFSVVLSAAVFLDFQDLEVPEETELERDKIRLSELNLVLMRLCLDAGRQLI